MNEWHVLRWMTVNNNYHSTEELTIARLKTLGNEIVPKGAYMINVAQKHSIFEIWKFLKIKNLFTTNRCIFIKSQYYIDILQVYSAHNVLKTLYCRNHTVPLGFTIHLRDLFWLENKAQTPAMFCSYLI